MANSGFRNFVINNRASTKRTNSKGITLPSQDDYKRMEARKIIEQRREEQELERMYDLNYY